MQYAERLPQTRSLLAPVLALVVGAGAATGAYALLDNHDTSLQPAAADVVVVETPAPSSSGLELRGSKASQTGTSAPVTGAPAPSSSGLELRGSKASQTGTSAPVTGAPGTPGTKYGTAQYRLAHP